MTQQGQHDDRWQRLDFGEAVRKARKKSQLDREVIRAVRSEAAGKTRGEIAALVGAERGRRDMGPLPAPLVDLWVDHVLAPNDAIFGSAVSAEVLLSLGRMGSRLIRLMRESGHATDDGWEASGTSPAMMRTDFQAVVRVDVDPNEEDALIDAHRTAAFRLRGLSGLIATIHPTAAPEQDGEITVLIDGRRVGQIPSADSAEFWPLFLPTDEAPQDVRTIAFVRRQTGSDELVLNIPVPI